MLLQGTRPHNPVLALFRHLGAIGLFSLAILDSSPIPGLAGPDILTAILAASKRNPWYEYGLVATAGSLIGAYLTYRLAKRAGEAWLHSKFGGGKASRLLGVFHNHGTGSLIAVTAIPIPLPTSVVFAAAGASNYPLGRFLLLVAICRGVRYGAIALLADMYGRHIVRVILHPTQYWGWLALFIGVVVALVAGGILVQRRLISNPAQ